MLRKQDYFADYIMVIEDQKWERLKQNHGFFNYKANESSEKIANDLRMWMRIKNL